MTESNFHIPQPRSMVPRPAQYEQRSVRYSAVPAPAVTGVTSVMATMPALELPANAILGPQRGLYRSFGKRVFDICFVVAIAPLAISLIGLASLFLMFEGGLPFYRQKRLGQNGKTFSILKLRTMVRDADGLLASYLEADPALRQEWDSTQKLKNDPRITTVGSFLRKTSLDELPQLWNVLKGEMSIVGPRPMMPDQLSLYGDARHYFSLKPGITGFWQVSERNESLFQLRMTLDAEYNRCVSLFQDLKVLVQTVGAVVRRTGY